MEVSGRTANEVWGSAADMLVHRSLGTMQASRIGNTREILHALLHIEDPRQRWVTVRSPGINPAFAVAEVVWILKGRNDAEFLNYWNRQLPKYAGMDECYHGAYGFRLRQAFGFDQLERAYDALRSNPDSRQINLQIWDARSDFPHVNGNPAAPDIPCNTNAFLKVRNGRLEWMQIMRSNDLVRGLPYNIIQQGATMNYWHLRGRKAQDRWQHGGEVLKQAQRTLDISERQDCHFPHGVLMQAAEDVSSVLDDTQRLYNSLHHAALEAQQRERS